MWANLDRSQWNSLVAKARRRGPESVAGWVPRTLAEAAFMADVRGERTFESPEKPCRRCGSTKRWAVASASCAKCYRPPTFVETE